MAHELEIVDGKAQMAYVGALPWHGLGTKVEGDITPDQFQKVVRHPFMKLLICIFFFGN